MSANSIKSLKPRSESVIQVLVANPEIRQGIIPDRDQDSVCLASALVRVNSDSKALTTVLNISEEEVALSSIEVTLEPFQTMRNQFDNPDPHINCINSESSISQLQKLEKVLRLDHLITEENQSLLQICR